MKYSAPETHSRSIAKAITYRLILVVADTVIAYFFTKDAMQTAGIVIALNAYRTLVYYFHERAWAHVMWGRKHD